jgi:hypothetical protein
MSDAEPFQILSPADYQRLTIDQKLRYLERAFRQSCALDSVPATAPEAAEQSAAAESKI